MRFLMLNWRDPKNPLSGGAERVSLAYLRELVRRGHEVYWFTYDFPGGAKEEIIEGIRVVRGGGKFTSIRQAIRWYRQQPRFDLVIDQHHGIPWLAPWWCGTRSISYIHEVLGPIWNSFYSWPLSMIGRWQERWTHRCYANQIFWTPSDSTRKDLERHGVRQVTVLPNGCDTTPLPELPSKPLDAPLRLITVCRLAPNKRVDHAIRAVKLLQQRGVAAKLTVVGSGEVQADLQQLVKELQLDAHVVFTGSLAEAEKNAQLRQAHLLLHTSVREGWGLNVIEANALGTPAFVYPVAGLVDSTVHGETGCVVKTETPEALAEELQALVQEPARYESYRLKAWQRAKQFQWSVTAAQTCDWLEQQAASSTQPK